MLMFACRAEEAGSCVGRRSRRFIQSKSSRSSRRRAKGLCPHASASGPPCCDLQLGRLITGSFDLRFMPALLFPSPRQQKACLNNLLLMKTLQERDGEPFAASSCSLQSSESSASPTPPVSCKSPCVSSPPVLVKPETGRLEEEPEHRKKRTRSPAKTTANSWRIAAFSP